MRKEIDEATQVAKNDKELPVTGLWTDVYSNNLEPKIRGITSYNIAHISQRKGVNH